MTERLETVVAKIDKLPNPTNVLLVKEFRAFLKDNGTSDRHQMNSIKAVTAFGHHLGKKTTFLMVRKKEQILAFLNTKEKTLAVDPDRKWVTTWNSYLNRIKSFMRFLHNRHGKKKEIPMSDWKTPGWAQIKEKRTKRLSPYSETEIWDRDELLSIVKYEPDLRNKAILTLCWDMDARPQEVCMLKIKHIRMRQNYGEGVVPAEAKTGSGPILLVVSFTYVRDLLNIHPLRNSPDAPLIISKKNGGHLTSDAIWKIFMDLKVRIKTMVERSEIADPQEQERLEILLRTKKWNPYCLRHSAITSDSDFLPGYALNKKVRWSMTSRQPNRYIKARMGDQLRDTILSHNGIIPHDEKKSRIPVISCPKCSHINALENKVCGKCGYPLSQQALDEIKAEEDKKVQVLQEQIKRQQDQIDYLMRHAQGKTGDFELVQEGPKVMTT
jgi:integrase/recombinase XerD